MSGFIPDTMLATFLERCDRSPDRVAIEELRAGGAAADVAMTWAEWRDASRSFAAALIADDVRVGDAVAVLAGNRLIWPIAKLLYIEKQTRVIGASKAKQFSPNINRKHSRIHISERVSIRLPLFAALLACLFEMSSW